MSLRSFVVMLLVVLVACPAAHAQDRSDLWRAYAAKLPAQTTVAVQLKNGGTVQGQIVQVTADRIVVLRKTRLPVPPEEFALDDIQSIEARKDGWSPGAKVLASVGAVSGVFFVILAAAFANSH